MSSGCTPLSAIGLSKYRGSVLGLICLQPLASSASLSHLSQQDRQHRCLSGWPPTMSLSVLHCQEHPQGFMVKNLRGVSSSCAEVAPQAQRDPQPTAAFLQCSLVLGWQLWLCFCWLHKYYFKRFWKGLGFFLMFHVSISTKYLH